MLDEDPMSWPVVNLAVTQNWATLILNHHLYIAVAMDLAHHHAATAVLVKHYSSLLVITDGTLPDDWSAFVNQYTDTAVAGNLTVLQSPSATLCSTTPLPLPLRIAHFLILGLLLARKSTWSSV